MPDTLPSSESSPAELSSQPVRTVVSIVEEQVTRGERTLTLLGRALLTARKAIEQSGLPMLNREELDRERTERRGRVDNG